MFMRLNHILCAKCKSFVGFGKAGDPRGDIWCNICADEVERQIVEQEKAHKRWEEALRATR